MKKFMGLTTLAVFLVTAFILYQGVTRDANTIPSANNKSNTSIVIDPNYSYISKDGNTLETRINVPQGYTRTTEADGSFGAFVRNYTMKADGSQVHLYDGSLKENQDAHVAVFDMTLENENLQQCADSVMRLFGEYYYKTGEYSKMRYSLGSFQADFRTWSEGNKLSFSEDGGTISWVASSDCDSSFESFKKFIRLVFAYSGTMNMEDDSDYISKDDMKIGDIFLKSGKPGHVVVVVDTCVNENGDRAFLLAQGFMPAQEFHVLKNPLHENDPWYYISELKYPFKTPEYTFEDDCLMRYRLNK